MQLIPTKIKVTSLFVICILLTISLHPLIAKEKKSTPLILISIDGFRYDYIEKYQPPNLLALIKNGVRAERMIPSYPTKTFPNHITLVTGMYPSNHGIVNNSFYDEQLDDIYKMGKAFTEPKWMQGTPLWIHAERHGVKSACYFWPESDSRLEGLAASFSYKYNKQTPYSERIAQTLNWLKLPKNERPQFITSYFSLVDSKGHQFGPDSIQVKNAVLEVDKHIGVLKSRIAKELNFKVNLVIVSDHGMVEIDPKQQIYTSDLDDFDGYIVVNGTTQLMLYAKKSKSKTHMFGLVNKLNSQSENRYQAFLKKDLPKNLNHFNNERIADIIIDAHVPLIFSKKQKKTSSSKGMHGYDPYLVPEMGALFIANGPNFKSGLTIPAFENIHVFPLLNHLLELPLPANIDGKFEVLSPTLNN